MKYFKIRRDLIYIIIINDNNKIYSSFYINKYLPNILHVNVRLILFLLKFNKII